MRYCATRKSTVEKVGLYTKLQFVHMLTNDNMQKTTHEDIQRRALQIILGNMSYKTRAVR